jgi:hypothetical protein
MTTKTKTKLLTQTETLAFALYLAAIAPDDERSAQALAVAEQIASTMTAKKVAAAKLLAEKRLKA